MSVFPRAWVGSSFLVWYTNHLDAEPFRELPPWRRTLGSFGGSQRGQIHLKGPYGMNLLVGIQYEQPRARTCGDPHIGARGCSNGVRTRKFPPY